MNTTIRKKIDTIIHDRWLKTKSPRMTKIYSKLHHIVYAENSSYEVEN